MEALCASDDGKARRPRRTAAQRRAQAMRAQERVVAHLLSAFRAVQAHRGGRLSALAAALLEVLDPTQSSQPKVDAETTDAGIQTHVEVMDRAVQMESAKSSAITGENDHQAEMDSAVLMESSKSSAITGKNDHQLMESSKSSSIIGEKMIIKTRRTSRSTSFLLPHQSVVLEVPVRRACSLSQSRLGCRATMVMLSSRALR